MDGYRNESITVNTTGTTPAGATLAPDRLGRRLSWYVKNLGAGTVDIFMGENKVITLNTGDYNLSVQGYVNDSSEDIYKCWQGAIRACASADGTTVIISERVFI